MHPVLLHIGPLYIYSLSVILIIGWGVFSFLFWKSLRTHAVLEDAIFDLMFLSTIVAFVFARLFYVLEFPDQFSDTVLQVAAIWVVPGLSFLGGAVVAVLFLLYVARRKKISLMHVLDALGMSLPPAILIGELGSFFDGSVAGKVTDLPWAVRYVGFEHMRHPVQLYSVLALICIMIVLTILARRARKLQWSYGVVGIWFFFLYSGSMFLIEYFKDSTVYFLPLTLNQWILLAIFAESSGGVFVRGGGRVVLRDIASRMKGGMHGFRQKHEGDDTTNA